MKYASFLERLIAFILDSVIFTIPFELVFGRLSDNTLVSALNLVLWTTYFVWMTGTYGATAGKMMLGIKIVKVDGTKLSYSDALLREIISYLSFFVLCLGYINIFFDDKKQSWHDKVAKTVVIKN